nr:SWIM zinc finger domain-containing protein [Actinomycetota bacterium]
MEPFELNEHLIREHSAPESMRKGEDYYRQGAVLSVTRRGAMLQAEVAGSDFAPYNVRVSFDEAGSTDATCSCPYD